MSINTESLPIKNYEAFGFRSEGDLVGRCRQNFLRNLKRFMAAKGITNADIAREFGISRSTAGAWVSGGTQPRFEDIDGLAEMLDQPVAAFFEDPSDSRSTGLDLDKAIRMVVEAAKKGSSQ